MKNRSSRFQPALSLCALAVSAAFAVPVLADELPDLGGGGAEPWRVDTYYENHTAGRGKDNTGRSVGLSKFRNTLQVEADKNAGNGWNIHSILRGTWDGVYRLNSSEYGKDAGGPILLENTGGAAVGMPTMVPQGGGLGHTAVAGAFGLTNNAFVDSYPGNPNDGLRVLGDRWHAQAGGVAFGVPVRPCDYDNRGCVNFGGYGNKTLSELELPEFNSRLDFIRELYARNSFTLSDGTELFVKVGKQQVVWGRTDLFRVLDVINPVDYSRNNIYDELQDIRIPMWILQTEWRMGASESMQDRNLQVVWNFDQFRANNLGQCGTPNVILDAGCFFRGMKGLWDTGGTVANFAAGGTLATNFGPGQIGIRNVNLPAWSFNNTQLGVKFEGITKDGLSFSLNGLTYRSQLPSLRAFNSAQNPFTGVNPDPTSHLIAFDMYFPRVNLIGGSLDLQSETLGAAFRLEGALTTGEEFANTARPELYSKNRVWRSVIGMDRPTFVPWINPHRTTLFSAQLFYQHIFDHELRQGAYGPVGMPDWEDNVIGTLLMKGFMHGDRVSPQVILARDFRARAQTVAPSLDWLVSNDLKLTFGANLKGGSNSRNQFDDCRSCNPYNPFTAYPGQTGAGSYGLGGYEPLGRFRAGPIGTAMAENEIFLMARYKF